MNTTVSVTSTTQKISTVVQSGNATGATSAPSSFWGAPLEPANRDMPSGNWFINDVVIYAKRMKHFKREDWMVYFAWVGLMSGLLFSVFGFMLVGFFNHVEYPAYAWNVPLGTLIFIGAIGFDTIGHRSVYKAALARGEALVHHITIAAGISSCILLCLAYSHPDFFRMPAYAMTLLTFMYSAIDEWMHWKRYMEGNSDRVEMWSHFGIFVGHSIMMAGWLYWFEKGYAGVAETLVHLKF